MTAPRIVVANGTVAVTRRSMFRKLFWTPSDPLVHRGYLYALADAQRQHGVEVHHGALVPTHEHLTITPREANLPEFLRHLHRESARFLQECMLARGYDAPENIWDSRSTHGMRLLGAGAQAAWVLYSHLNCVAAGLIERVDEYPGWTSDLGLMKGSVVVVKKPPIYFSEDKPDELVLKITPPPALVRAFDGDLDAMVHWMRRTARDMEDAYRDERREAGMCVVGAARIKKIHPYAEPRTPRERRGQRIPAYKISGLDGELSIDERLLAKHCGGERIDFVRENRACYLQWRAGDRSVVFPAGTYGMRVLHGATVGAPAVDAVLCVGDDLTECATIPIDQRKTILAAIAGEMRAFAEEDAERLDDLADSVEGAQPESTAVDADLPETRPPAHAVPLASPTITAQLEHASRITTLRTRRDRGPPE